MSPLYAQMHRWAATPFAWGQSDCALSLADWYHATHGVDPAAHLRGAYFDLQTCQRACGWFSDPVAVIEGCLDTVRKAATDYPRGVNAPQPGDVAVIQLHSAERVIPAGALWLGSVWGCKGPAGVTTVAPRMAQPLAIWGMGYAA